MATPYYRKSAQALKKSYKAALRHRRLLSSTYRGRPPLSKGTRNAKLVVKDGKLVIVSDLRRKGKLSNSGRSMVLATTGGAAEIPGLPGWYVALNVYRKIDVIAAKGIDLEAIDEKVEDARGQAEDRGFNELRDERFGGPEGDPGDD